MVRFCFDPPSAGIIGYSEEWDARVHKGNLRVISPEEILHAFVIRVAEDLERGTTTESLNIWQSCFLNTPMVFVPLESELSAYFTGVNQREDIGSKYENLYRTPVQRAYEITSFRRRRELERGQKVSVAELVSLWNQHVKMSNMADSKVDKNYIDVCCVVSDRLLSCAPIREVILECEELFQRRTPFDSIFKLEIIARRTSKAESRALWLVTGLKDLVQNADYSGGELSVRALSGKGQGGRGLVDLLLYKLDLKEFLLTEWLEKLEGPSAGAKKLLREVMTSHKAYRLHFGFENVPEAEKKDKIWLGVLSVADRSLFRFIEVPPKHICYTCVCVCVFVTSRQEREDNNRRPSTGKSTTRC